MSRLTALIEDSVAAGLPDMALTNCHAKGIESIVLRVGYREDGTKTFMQRLFVAYHDIHQLDELFLPNGQFTVGVHNHRYPLTIQPVVGVIKNFEVHIDPKYSSLVRAAREDEQFTYELVDRGGDWQEIVRRQSAGKPNLFEFKFTSGIGGEASLEFVTGRRSLLSDYACLVPGDLGEMTSADLHTVVVPKLEGFPLTAWLVTEFEDDNSNPLFYSPIRHPVMDATGLYDPLDVSEAERILEEVLKCTRVFGDE